MTSPDKQHDLHWSHIIFVDDENLIHSTTAHDPTVNELRNLVQKEVTMWNDGLHTTGGYLNGNKSKFYILNWLFQKYGTPYLDQTIDTTTPVTIFHQNTIEHIHQITPDYDKNEYKHLGVRTPASLRDTYELKHILKKGKKFSKVLTACPVTKLEAWTAYNMFFVPSYTYSAVTISC